MLGGEGEKWKKFVAGILCRTGPSVKEIARRKIMKIMCGKTGKTVFAEDFIDRWNREKSRALAKIPPFPSPITFLIVRPLWPL